MAQRNKKWLSLQEAAAQLGVHFTTVRRWVDQGAIPTLLTPGGHRRFSPEDLEDFARRHRRHYIREGLEDAWQRQALRYTRDALRQQRAGWMNRFDNDTANRLRNLGNELMDVIMQYIGSDGADSERIRRRAEDIGRDYARLSRSGSMTLSELLQAMSFFKNGLLDATLSMPETQSKPQLNSRIISRMNEVLSAVEVSIADYYDNR